MQAGDYFSIIICFVFLMLTTWKCVENYPCELTYDVSDSSFRLYKLKSFLFKRLNSFGLLVYYLIKSILCIIPLLVIKEYNLEILFTLFVLSLTYSKIILPLLWTFSLCHIFPSINVNAIIYYLVYIVFVAKETFCSIYTITNFLTVVQKARGKISIDDLKRDEEKQKEIDAILELERKKKETSPHLENN